MEKKCVKCYQMCPMSQYRKYKDDKYSNTCKKCLNEMDKIRKKMKRQKKNESIVKCELCSMDKPLKLFAKLKKFYKRKICLECYPSFLTKQKTDWCKKESLTNVNYRIKKSIAARLRTVLKKTQSTMSYIGCNIAYLREWFEFNFTPEMNWNNYGSYWSIDHIIPVCNFDLTDEKEKMYCWNWSNMMPVTINFNSKKKKIDQAQVNYILTQLTKFKEEGSTTKWFSEEFILNEEIIKQKIHLFTKL